MDCLEKVAKQFKAVYSNGGRALRMKEQAKPLNKKMTPLERQGEFLLRARQSRRWKQLAQIQNALRGIQPPKFTTQELLQHDGGNFLSDEGYHSPQSIN